MCLASPWSVDTISVWFPLGRHYECVMEKAASGWRLRVLERGVTVLEHPIDEQLAARLLSERCNCGGAARSLTRPNGRSEAVPSTEDSAFAHKSA